ncbi:hypothetical protein NDU88_006197 [Pleurodeles waltl]|uniref:Uncharacterized protein n=1 Tax=Pleurodeles waltl TaxID=8319 RepID=A0AAV7SP22_PLEWA|nr:hypothetical protein NDU88_006197 [Pleurodeles waltl]
MSRAPRPDGVGAIPQKMGKVGRRKDIEQKVNAIVVDSLIVDCGIIVGIVIGIRVDQLIYSVDSKWDCTGKDCAIDWILVGDGNLRTGIGVSFVDGRLKIFVVTIVVDDSGEEEKIIGDEALVNINISIVVTVDAVIDKEVVLEAFFNDFVINRLEDLVDAIIVCQLHRIRVDKLSFSFAVNEKAPVRTVQLTGQSTAQQALGVDDERVNDEDTIDKVLD